jgi:hypothetical protein
MVMLGERLQERKEDIIQRWTDAVLATYPVHAAAMFGREQDRFANPVGHSVRTGTRGIVEALCTGLDAERVRASLREILKVRAIQQFTPSQALGFVFHLKDVIRAELADTVEDPAAASDLAAIDGEIDRIALAAFDVFTECREQVYQLRIEEVKRRVAWVVGKMNQSGEDPEA